MNIFAYFTIYADQSKAQYMLMASRRAFFPGPQLGHHLDKYSPEEEGLCPLLPLQKFVNIESVFISQHINYLSNQLVSFPTGQSNM